MTERFAVSDADAPLPDVLTLEQVLADLHEPITLCDACGPGAPGYITEADGFRAPCAACVARVTETTP